MHWFIVFEDTVLMNNQAYINSNRSSLCIVKYNFMPNIWMVEKYKCTTMLKFRVALEKELSKQNYYLTKYFMDDVIGLKCRHTLFQNAKTRY